MWSAVGLMLIRIAARWLVPLQFFAAVDLVVAGLALAVPIYAFGFSRFADKNIRRIEAYPDRRVCIFAFQSWSSYPLVVVMISLGLYLRLYSPFPKWMLAIIYLGIGGGLFLASWQYYFRLLALPASSDD